MFYQNEDAFGACRYPTNAGLAFRTPTPFHGTVPLSFQQTNRERRRKCDFCVVLLHCLCGLLQIFSSYPGQGRNVGTSFFSSHAVPIYNMSSK